MRREIGPKFEHCTKTLKWRIHMACITFINQSTVIGTAFSVIILLVLKFRLTLPRWFWYWWLYSCGCNAISSIGNNLFSWLLTKPSWKGAVKAALLSVFREDLSVFREDFIVKRKRSRHDLIIEAQYPWAPTSTAKKCMDQPFV